MAGPAPDGDSSSPFLLRPPRYGDASLPDLLPSVLTALGAPGFPDALGLGDAHAGIRRAAVLLVDGLGYHLLDAVAQESPAMAEIVGGRLGVLERLTTGFPSTTPVSLAGLATGVVPGRHGIVGFSVRVPGTDRVLNHIRWQDDPWPEQWQPVPTCFERARAVGIDVRVVNRPEFVGSGLTRAVYRGADYVGATGIEPLADSMIDALGTGVRPTLVYGYHPSLDTAGHVQGLGSPEWFDQARRLERLVARLTTRLPADVPLFITADHGQLSVPADRRFDLDGDPRLRAGVELVAGEPRVRYLHTLPGATGDVLATWRGILGGAARVMSRDEAIATGWYGPFDDSHRARLGDVVVVCLDDYAIVATIADAHESEMVGMHGSLTALEMDIPLITLRR
jgi:hypothetical protein